MRIDNVLVRKLVLLGNRGAFGKGLYDLLIENKDIIVLSADLGNTSGLGHFITDFPDNYINIGIAEQNLIGVAAGLAAEKYIPYAVTFANFITLRACEQVRHFMGYMQENVKIVGIGAGFEMGMFGNTHYGMEDMSVIRSIPNIIIVSPADTLETYKMVREISKISAPVYLRITKSDMNTKVYAADYDLEIGKMICLKDGQDIALFATGSMVFQSLKAAEILEKKGISVKVVNVHTIRPLDLEYLHEIAGQIEVFVTVEEHSIIGGLGSSIAEYLAKYSMKPRQIVIGAENYFNNVGDYQFLIRKNRLDAQNIVDRIERELK